MCRKGNPNALLVGMSTSAALMENSMAFPPAKNRISLIVNSSISGYKSQRKTLIHKDIYRPMFMAMFIIASYRSNLSVHQR